MHQRCTCPGQVNWEYYGGAGIRVCERWNRFRELPQRHGRTPARSLVSTASIRTGTTSLRTAGGPPRSSKQPTGALGVGRHGAGANRLEAASVGQTTARQGKVDASAQTPSPKHRRRSARVRCPSASSPQQSQTQSKPRFAVTAGRIDSPQRVLAYGPGGIGKTTLSSLAPGCVYIDLEDGSKHLDVQRIEGIQLVGADLRACLQSDVLDGFRTMMIEAWVTKARGAGRRAHARHGTHGQGRPRQKTLEDYNWGKGPTHVYDVFLHLLADCDLNVRRGRNVILIAHETVNDAPNPYGEDFIRYEPSLQAPKQGKKDTGNIRNRVIQWADHVLFIGYDVHSEDGKGKGAAGAAHDLPKRAAVAQGARAGLSRSRCRSRRPTTAPCGP